GLSNRGKTVPKRANRNGNHVLARREEIGDRRFLSTCTGGRVGQYRGGRLEEVLQACGNATHYGGEFWPAMVNHWLCHGGQYLWRHRSWTRDAEILHGYGCAWFHLRYWNSFSFLDSHGALSLSIYVCCYYFVTLHMRVGNLATARVAIPVPQTGCYISAVKSSVTERYRSVMRYCNASCLIAIRCGGQLLCYPPHCDNSTATV